MSKAAQANQFDFVVVANRLPVDLITEAAGSQRWQASPGGLVSALEPVLEQHEGCWVGWPGVADVAPEPFRTDGGIQLHPVVLSEREYQEFYEGFSNATLWPLYHDLIVKPEYHRTWWESYREVNLKFADEVASVAAEGATVFVQDYQLQLVPGILRQLRPDLKIGFFLHIPFPSSDLFRQLPWREEIIRGLLGADLLGFHLEGNAANFLALARQVSGAAGSHTGQPDELTVTGSPSVREVTASITSPDGREVGVAAFPIAIDTAAMAAQATEADADALRASIGNPKHLILGVDRLDYTKGILQRLRALEELLATGAIDAEDTVFMQIATPSRERLEHYRATRSQVEEAVGRINGRFGTLSHHVVHYVHRSIPKHRLAALYAAADIMLVTPFKDGMNLVCKEYVACHPEGGGALVLSEFAGAAAELDEAFLCNPFDIESAKRQLLSAVYTLDQDPEEAKRRMIAMNQQVAEHDVAAWAAAFTRCLDAAGARKDAQ